LGFEILLKDLNPLKDWRFKCKMWFEICPPLVTADK